MADTPTRSAARLQEIQDHLSTVVASENWADVVEILDWYQRDVADLLALVTAPPQDQLVSDILADYRDELDKAACDRCEDCGPLMMCRFHSILSLLQRDTMTQTEYERRRAKVLVTAPERKARPLLEEAPTCEKHGTMTPRDEMGREWYCAPCQNSGEAQAEHTAPEREPQMPPLHVIDFAVEVSRWSPCRSKRGVVIFNGDDILGHGYNYKPRGFDCDDSEKCKATCRVEAIHAEQQALLAVGRRASGADLLHAKTVDGVLVASGGPSCIQCSKLALVSGIAGVWLFHENGWRRYETAEFHRLSLEQREAAEAELAALRHTVSSLREKAEQIPRYRTAEVNRVCDSDGSGVRHGWVRWDDVADLLRDGSKEE